MVFTPLAFLGALFSGNWEILVLGFLADVVMNVLLIALHLVGGLIAWVFGGTK